MLSVLLEKKQKLAKVLNSFCIGLRVDRAL